MGFLDGVLGVAGGASKSDSVSQPVSTNQTQNNAGSGITFGSSGSADTAQMIAIVAGVVAVTALVLVVTRKGK